MWCGLFISPQFLHSLYALAGKASWDRRILRRDLEVFFLGTAIVLLAKNAKKLKSPKRVFWRYVRKGAT